MSSVNKYVSKEVTKYESAISTEVIMTEDFRTYDTSSLSHFFSLFYDIFHDQLLWSIKGF